MPVRGLQLGELLHAHVAGVLARRVPELRYSSALLGAGSEVLGLDDARSQDHDWGPRLQVFLADLQHVTAVSDALADELPDEVAGVPTRFRAEPHGSRHPDTGAPRASHGVTVVGLADWLHGQLGFDPRSGVTTADWLATPTQRLLEVTSGAVFRDDDGALAACRAALDWYPVDVWRHVLACQWQLVAEAEAFVGRCGEVGDELGSAMVAGRLARHLMRLACVQHRRYPPYDKWLGTVFARLPGAPVATLADAVHATDWRSREAALVEAARSLGERQNALRLADRVEPGPRRFHDRPFRVSAGERFAAALRAAVGDAEVRALPLSGAVDQWTDNVHAYANVSAVRAAQGVMTSRARR